ncbi:MAG: hypothetical protein Q4G43_16555 [Mobilicoccus sp.]|nr:hypothetical protein [Mobilicoccus sp.]
MLTPDRWALVAGVAMAFVALAGTALILIGDEDGFAWVIVGLAALSSLAAFGVAAAQRRR